jgi:hypothetical protein
MTDIGSDERESLSAIADDALTVFRLGLFLIVIYISILSLVLQSGGPEYVSNTVDSTYTIFGVTLWVGSVTSSILTYRVARRVTLQDRYTQLGKVDDKFDVLNLATASTVGLLITVFSLIMGLLEGWIATVNEGSVGVGIEQPLIIVVISATLILGIYAALGVLDMVRDRWGPIRENLP